jgi:hypothetical protein
MAEGGLGISLNFDGIGPDPDAVDAVEPHPTPNGLPPPAHPLVALLPTARRARPASQQVSDAVEELLGAVGLVTAAVRHVTVTTQAGTWRQLHVTEPVVIGRSVDQADLVVDDPAVSRQHVRLLLDERGQPVVEDLASANGSWIHRGEQRIDLTGGRGFPLEHGDWVRSGPVVMLAYIGFDEESDR